MSSTTASRYRSLKIEEPDDEVVFDADHYATVSNQAESSRCFLLLALLSTLLLVLGFSTGIFFCQFRAPRSTITEKLLNAHTFSSQAHHPAISSQPKLCQKVSTRREWRTLSGREKQDYISAVQCFTATPSGLRQEGTLYDDFSSVHSEYANTSELCHYHEHEFQSLTDNQTQHTRHLNSSHGTGGSYKSMKTRSGTDAAIKVPCRELFYAGKSQTATDKNTGIGTGRSIGRISAVPLSGATQLDSVATAVVIWSTWAKRKPLAIA